ncbi:MAG: ATPase, T2SS/T4P/T4SS family [Bdellovibrionales bacterium]
MSVSRRSLKSRKLLGNVLVEMGYISEGEIKNYLEQAKIRGTRLGQYLVEQNIISENDLARAIAQQFEMDYNDLRGEEAQAEALELIAYPLAQEHGILPLSLIDKTLRVVSFDPLAALNVTQSRKLLPYDVIISIGPESIVKRSIENFYLKKQSEEDQKKVESRDNAHRAMESITHVSDKPGSVEALINRILDQAVGHQASDIHLEPQEDELQIRERIDGILEKSLDVPMKLHAAMVSRLKIMANLDIAEKRAPQDGRFNYVSRGKNIDFRVSTLPTIRGEKVVMRLLDKSNMKIDLDRLGLTQEMGDQFRHLLSHPYGILLVTGPTGSGKTTTVYSMLNHLNSMEKNIITVEDPVEYQFQIINQVQVNPKINLTFSSALRTILRQDPDILMIGEIRDKETADIAVRAALTGHLVISTIHTNDSATAVSRLVDMGIDPFMISSSLLGVVSQRLVRKLCVHCKEEVKTTDNNLTPLHQQLLEQNHTIYRAKGCEKCFETGYTGREGVYELLIPDNQTRKAINDGASAHDIQELLRQVGFTTMREDGIRKIIEGITSVEEVLKSNSIVFVLSFELK